jgi:hypothetical protein
MLVIPATQEMETERSQSKAGQGKSIRPYIKTSSNKTKHRVGR